MKTIKHLFLFILCAGLFGGAALNVSAQNALKPADVERVVAFYEWAFQTKFTAEQRGAYQAIKAEQYQGDPAATKKGIDDMLATFAAVRAKNENEQEKVRQMFIGNFVEELRKGTDGESKLLALVYDNAQAAINAEAASGGDDISPLAGKWVWSRTGGTTWTQGGAYVGGNGSRFTYQFYPNGAVEFTGIMNVMQGGCSQQIFRSIKGQASLSGDTLTIRWSPEKFTRDFSCDSANNYTKSQPAKTERLKVSFRNDSGQRQLCILGSECFSEFK